MPYIIREDRQAVDSQIDKLIEAIHNQQTSVDGILNYTISRIVAETILLEGGTWRYHLIAKAVAVFECAKLEFYRRVGAAYESLPQLDNGDLAVYSPATGAFGERLRALATGRPSE